MVSSSTTTFKKVLIICLYIILGLVLLLIGIGYFGLKPLLTKRIQTAVLNSTDNLYHLDFKNIKYDIMSGNASISDVTWQADSMLYDSLKSLKKMPDNIYQGKVKEINLTGLHPWTIFLSKKLELNAISISNPSVEIIHDKQAYNSFKTASSPYQVISKFVKSFSVEKISFNNINFTYKNLSESKNAYTSRIENLDLEVSNLLIDAFSDKDSSRFYYTRECVFNLKKLEFPTHDSLNTVKISAITFSTKTRLLTIDSLLYLPKYKIMEYGSHTQGNDRIQIMSKNIRFENIDLRKLFEDKKIYAERLNISKGNVWVFSDTRPYKGVKKVSYRPYPHQSFKDWAAKFMIEKLNLKNFDITYSEYNPETNLVGNVYFTQINGSFTNLTNDTLTLAKDSHCLLFLKAKLMNKGNMSLKFNFDIAAPNGDFTCSGKVVDLKMSELNHVIKSLAMAKAEDGFVEQFSFNMKGNKYGLNGSSTLIYKDLNVTFLKNTKKDKSLKNRKFFSFIANAFVIKNSNPIRNKPIRISKINYRRVPLKPFFGTLWAGLLQGMKGAIM